MERDEHEMLIEYSEMTSFDFNSKEFQEARKDYLECKNYITNLVWIVKDYFTDLSEAKKA